MIITLLVDPQLAARLDRVAQEYRKRLPGSRITRPDATRAAIRVGLDAIEHEMSIVVPTEKKPPEPQ